MFMDDLDRSDFCDRTARTIAERGWLCRSFCLMPTHYHLILDVDENALQAGMHAINGQYAQRFNARHGRSGHLCGDRYRAVRIEAHAHMLRAFRYVARNPVKAGLCRSPADWTWSSYRGCIGLEAGFEFVTHEPIYDYFHADRARAIRELRQFVEDA